MRRQSEVAETFSDVLVRVFINADNIWDEIQHGEHPRGSVTVRLVSGNIQ
jgi:hypothetical protein